MDTSKVRQQAEQEVAARMKLEPNEVPRGWIVDSIERALLAEQQRDRLAEALRRIVEVASGEEQVAFNDTDGMAWIDKFARAALDIDDLTAQKMAIAQEFMKGMCDPRVAVVADELRGPHNHSERQPEHTAVRILAKIDAMIDTRRPEPKCPHGFPASRCNLPAQGQVAPPIPVDFTPEEHHFTAGEIAYINSDGDSHTARMVGQETQSEQATQGEQPVKNVRGFSLYFTREQWGYIFDGLIEQAAILRKRKVINPESTADVTVSEVEQVIREIGAACDPHSPSTASELPPLDKHTSADPYNTLRGVRKCRERQLLEALDTIVQLQTRLDVWEPKIQAEIGGTTYDH